MKFLFLDVDGVLNSEAFLKRLDASYIPGVSPKTHYAWENQIDHEVIARLNAILQAVPDTQVVLSSSWRLLVDVDEVQRILTKHGFAGTLVDATPNLPNDPVYVKLRADGLIDRISRGHEIAYWLECKFGVDPRFSTTIAATALMRHIHEHDVRITILDDSNDMVFLKPWHVCTDPQVGLNDINVEHAIALLLKQPLLWADDD